MESRFWNATDKFGDVDFLVDEVHLKPGDNDYYINMQLAKIYKKVEMFYRDEDNNVKGCYYLLIVKSNYDNKPVVGSELNVTVEVLHREDIFPSGYSNMRNMKQKLPVPNSKFKRVDYEIREESGYKRFRLRREATNKVNAENIRDRKKHMLEVHHEIQEAKRIRNEQELNDINSKANEQYLKDRRKYIGQIIGDDQVDNFEWWCITNHMDFFSNKSLGEYANVYYNSFVDREEDEGYKYRKVLYRGGTERSLEDIIDIKFEELKDMYRNEDTQPDELHIILQEEQLRVYDYCLYKHRNDYIEWVKTQSNNDIFDVNNMFNYEIFKNK